MMKLEQIRAAIPRHCFQRSELRFFLSILQSFIILIPIIVAGCYIPINWYWSPAWIIYGIISGTVAFGVWILGHQCGHQAFSSNKILNHTVGYLLHTFLLVPYFSWRWSHHIHHNNNNHVQQGESHVPIKQQRIKQSKYATLFINSMGDYAPLAKLFVILGPGWLSYLFIGATGGRTRGRTNHFIAPNKLFPMNKALEVYVSTFGIIVMLVILYKLALIYSFTFIGLIYIFPWAVTHSWLSVVTLLQHTQKQVKWYDNRKWNWVLGAISTIDRNYPWIIDELHHYIGTTHVMHHLFPQVPHYHAKEATQAIKKVLGKNYYYDKTPFLKALYQSCKLLSVKDEGNGDWSF